MYPRNHLIALFVAVLITAVQFVGMSYLAANARQNAPRTLARPGAAIPMLPTITVRPTSEEVRAAFAGEELASTTHPDYVMPFYSFATRPTVVNKG
jgi:hypothetical protein